MKYSSFTFDVLKGLLLSLIIAALYALAHLDEVIEIVGSIR
jgi:hypothetical protein